MVRNLRPVKNTFNLKLLKRLKNSFTLSASFSYKIPFMVSFFCGLYTVLECTLISPLLISQFPIIMFGFHNDERYRRQKALPFYRRWCLGPAIARFLSSFLYVFAFIFVSCLRALCLLWWYNEYLFISFTKVYSLAFHI